jgi:endonuclease/exonuclease/phosphatase (EEP) superfamily protein YafD
MRSLMYARSLATILDKWRFDTETPLIVAGDFNIKSSNERLLGFMQKHFNLTLASGNQITTLNRTTVDLAFARNMTVKCKSYISYYSHHCPLFNRIVSVANDLRRNRGCQTSK